MSVDRLSKLLLHQTREMANQATDFLAGRLVDDSDITQDELIEQLFVYEEAELPTESGVGDTNKIKSIIRSILEDKFRMTFDQIKSALEECDRQKYSSHDQT